MSDPYNQYNQYQSPPPHGQGYPPPDQYNQHQYGQQPGYPPQQQQQQQQQQYGTPEPGFGPPQRVNSYGPPQAGGFQHGQQGGQFGAYDASNPQGQPGYYGPPGGQELYRSDPSTSGSPYPQLQHPYGHPGSDPNQAGYGQTPGQPPYDPNAPPYDPNAPFDPNAPEGERGLGTALAGGAAGYWAGHQKGHGFLGAVGGAILGNFVGDKFKEHQQHKQDGSQSGGGSSWGGKW